MRRYKKFLLLILCILIFAGAVKLVLGWYRMDVGTPRIEIIQAANDKQSINVYVTRSQIKKEISPIAIKEFISKTEITSANKELTLVDFSDDGMLPRYGFRKGDIITAINGQQVGSMQEAVKICTSLGGDIFKNRNEKEINVSLTRDGEDINMNFKIPEFVPEKAYYTMNLKKRIGK